MSGGYDRAAKKLEDERKAGKYDRYADVMKGAVCEALAHFCRQDEGFAQAVAQGGSFEDCMKAVAKECGSAVSDLEAYRRAVRFYCPEADVKFHMTIDRRAGAKEDGAGQVPDSGLKLISLEDFL